MDKTNENEVLEPGCILKKAREKNGFSVEQVAHFLRLSQGMILAIENNDFSEIPAPMFVRGYLRSYANMLSIPSDALVQQYDASLLESESQKAEAFSKENLMKKKPEKNSKFTKRISLDGLIRLISIVILFFFLGLTVLWWQSNQSIIKEKVLSLRAKITNKHTVLVSENVSDAPIDTIDTVGEP